MNQLFITKEISRLMEETSSLDVRCESVWDAKELERINVFLESLEKVMIGLTDDALKYERYNEGSAYAMFDSINTTIKHINTTIKEYNDCLKEREGE